MKENKTDLIISKNEGNIVSIPENSRFKNIAVIGTKNTGKTTNIMSSFAEQFISNTQINAGATFIVNGKDEAYYIYSIIQRQRKKTCIRFFKPNSDLKTYKAIIENNKYDFDEMNKFIDFRKEIRDKSINIIDLEEVLYSEKSVLLTRKILQHLYISIQYDKDTLGRNHYLFIDDADEYIDDLEKFLRYGEDFNLSITLFINSLSLLNFKYKNIIETNVKNYILLSKLIYEDYLYFAEKFSYFLSKSKDDILKSLINRSYNSIYYEILLKNNKTEIGNGKFYSNIDNLEEKSLKLISDKLKKKLLISDNNLPIKILSDEFNKKYFKIKDKPIQKEDKEPIQKIEESDNYLKETTDSVSEAILDNVKNIKDLYQDEHKFDLKEVVEEATDLANINNELNNNLLSTVKKKKKKKKKKHNNQDELIQKNITESESETALSQDKEALSINKPINDLYVVDENILIPLEVEEDAYPIIEEDEIPNDIDDESMIISINSPNIIKEKDIDTDLADSLENIIDEDIEIPINLDVMKESNLENKIETTSNTPDKQFFDLDALFDEDE